MGMYLGVAQLYTHEDVFTSVLVGTKFGSAELCTHQHVLNGGFAGIKFGKTALCTHEAKGVGIDYLRIGRSD